LRYIPLKDIEKVLRENAKIYGDKFGITKEMIELINKMK